MSAPVFTEGDLARVHGWRGVGRIIKFNLVRAETDVWFVASNGNASMRTVETSRLRPAHRGDTVDRVPEMAPPTRRTGQR